MNTRLWIAEFTGGKKLTVLMALLCLWTASAQAAFIVNSNDDVDDGTCNAAHCSLREAIHAANASLGSDVIDFNSAMPLSRTTAPTRLTAT